MEKKKIIDHKHMWMQQEKKKRDLKKNKSGVWIYDSDIF